MFIRLRIILRSFCGEGLNKFLKLSNKYSLRLKQVLLIFD
ncbi:hypothetical protein SAMN04487765_3722 [Tenacibaculum sp. MAR_2010_89]|nr:hypothetical protein SAMN04487765_3722 [Tenacibaculum sp. MAR_2010_89]